MEKEHIPLIISSGDKFRLYRYKSEKELESIAVKHSKEIFGENTVYIDAKKKITSAKGISGIPDGYMIDLDHNKLYIVEIELEMHDIIRHITNQLFRFKVAMGSLDARAKLAADLNYIILQKRLKSDISLADIQKIVNSKFGIVIIIDVVSEQLMEIVNNISQDGTDVIAVPFETYIDSKNTSYVYKFTAFTKEALEKESKKWTFKWTTIPVEKHFESVGEDMKSVFSTLSKQICLLPNVKEKSRKNWITYQTSPLKNFCTIKVLPKSLEIHIKSNKIFRDERGMTKSIKRTPAWTFDRVFNIDSDEDIDYAMYIIKQAYDCTCK